MREDEARSRHREPVTGRRGSARSDAGRAAGWFLARSLSTIGAGRGGRLAMYGLSAPPEQPMTAAAGKARPRRTAAASARQTAGGRAPARQCAGAKSATERTAAPTTTGQGAGDSGRQLEHDRQGIQGQAGQSKTPPASGGICHQRHGPGAQDRRRSRNNPAPALHGPAALVHALAAPSKGSARDPCRRPRTISPARPSSSPAPRSGIGRATAQHLCARRRQRRLRRPQRGRRQGNRGAGQRQGQPGAGAQGRCHQRAAGRRHGQARHRRVRHRAVPVQLGRRRDPPRQVPRDRRRR